MKLSSLQRWLFEAINFLLVLTFMIPVSSLLGVVFGYGGQHTIWVLSFAVLGFLVGRFTMRMSAGGAMFCCFISAAAAAAACGLTLHFLTGGFRAHLGGNLCFMIVALIGSIMFYFWARKAGYTIYAPMTTVGVLLHLVSLLVLSAMKAPELQRNISSWAAIIFFLLALYAYNARGLRKSVYVGERSRSVHLPRGIQMSSFLLVTGFIMLALLFSWLGPAIPALGGLLGRGLLLAIRGVGTLIGMVDQLTSLMGPMSPLEDSAENEEGGFMMDDVVKEHSDFVNSLINVFGFVIVIILGIVLLVMFYNKFLKGLKGVQELMNKLRGMFEPEHIDDYVDETESLFSWKKALDSATEGIRNALHRITDRPQKFDDFETGRLKIRFVYQHLLKRRMEQDGGASGPYETPNELQTHLQPEAEGFIATYNSVRYANAEPTPEEIAQAQALWKQK